MIFRIWILIGLNKYKKRLAFKRLEALKNNKSLSKKRFFHIKGQSVCKLHFFNLFLGA
jgi:hypothetical protein